MVTMQFRAIAGGVRRAVLEDLLQDVRHACRVLAASPGFTVAAVLSIALGLGVAIGVYSQIDGMVLAPLKGVREPETLVATRAVSFPVFEAFAEDGPFRQVAAYASVPVAWNDTDRTPRRIWAHAVSSNYFSVLGTEARLGRLFGAEEDPQTVVLTERLWQRDLGGDPGIVGRELRLNGQLLTVIGVAEEGFAGASPMVSQVDVWLQVTADTPFVPASSAEVIEDGEASIFSVVGRLEEGIPVARSEAQLDAIVRRFIPVERRDDLEYRGRQISLLNGGRRLPIRDQDLPVLLGATSFLVILILGVAAANVGTLLLARAAARRQEVAIRLGLGASRNRILRQFLTESLVLAIVAGIAGYGVGWGYKALVDSATAGVTEAYSVAIDPLPMGVRMLVVSLGLSLGCGLMFGIAPAFHAVRSSVAEAMKPGAKLTLGRFRWWSVRNLLVLQQVAGSLALLLLTGFVVLGVFRTTGSELGFNGEDLYMVSLDPARDGYPRERAIEFLTDLPERTRLLSEVQSASLSYDAPVGLRSAEVYASMQASTEMDLTALTGVQTRRIGRRFLETLELPLLRGEPLGREDEENLTSPRVLVNATLAAETWPNEEPVGQILELDERSYQVAGVVGDIQVSGVMARTPPTVFRLLRDQDLASPSAFGITLILRSLGSDPIGPIREMLGVTDPDVVLFNVTTVRREVDSAKYLTEINMMVYGGIGLFGLILAGVGISGITAYAVVQRRKEIGLRLALGATSGQILRLVTREGAVLVILGMAFGLGISYAVARLLGALYTGIAEATGTTTSDPFLLVGGPLLLGLLTMLAAYLPARKALRINPATALKEE